MELRKAAIFGASSFAREVADICVTLGFDETVFIDLNPEGNSYFNFPLLAEDKILELINDDFSFIIGVGDNHLREKIYKKYSHLHFPNIIHPSASFGFKQHEHISGSSGNIIAAGVRMTNNIRIGNFSIFNLNCTVGHDCIFDDFINIAPGVNISGNVYLKEKAFIGAGATILQGKSLEDKLTIGRNCLIGASALVHKNISDNSVAYGIPAKIRKHK